MRLIDADKILKKMRSVMDMQDLYLPTHFKEMVIDEMPTIDAEPIRHGHWVVKEDVFGEGEARVAFFAYATCSVCGDIFYDVSTIGHKPIWDYCPRCGAKMDEVTE